MGEKGRASTAIGMSRGLWDIHKDADDAQCIADGDTYRPIHDIMTYVPAASLNVERGKIIPCLLPLSNIPHLVTGHASRNRRPSRQKRCLVNDQPALVLLAHNPRTGRRRTTIIITPTRDRVCRILARAFFGRAGHLVRD